MKWERRNASGMKSPGMNNSFCFRALWEGGDKKDTVNPSRILEIQWKQTLDFMDVPLQLCLSLKSLWKIPPVPSTNGYRLMSRGIMYGMVPLSGLYGWMGQNRLYVIPIWFDICYALPECNSLFDFHHFLPILLIICSQFRHKTSAQRCSGSQSSTPTPLMLRIGISGGELRRTPLS
jgi:hypothetical protein